MATFVVGCQARALHTVDERRVEAKMDGTLFHLPEAEQGPQEEGTEAQPRLSVLTGHKSAWSQWTWRVRSRKSTLRV